MEKASGYFRAFVLNFIRLMLALAILIAMYSSRDLVFVIAIISLGITFIPLLSRVIFGFKIPAEVEIMVLFSIYGLLVFGSVRGFEFWWWDILLNLGAAAILGFIGLTVFFVLDKEEIINASPFIVVFFTFCFAFSLGALWEMFEFFLDSIFGFGLQSGGLSDTMKDLVVNALGAIIVSVIGAVHLRSGKRNFMSLFISRFLKRYFKFFKSKRYFEHSSNLISRLIDAGEGDFMEFKSTLRKNLHTGIFDKKIEHSVLKTIVAYLNSKGGTILVGVSDLGRVLGLKEDDFSSHDKLQLYLTGALRTHLGNQFLHYINYELYPIEDKHILKIDCSPSNKRVFLKWDKKEEFYVRHGSSSIHLYGGDLVDYIRHRFS